MDPPGIEIREGVSGFYRAIYNGDEDLVKRLLDRGADINANFHQGVSPLYIASQKGHEKIVEFLLDGGADGEARTDKGWSPLYIASKNGHENTVNLLLDSGADIETRTDKGWSPLCIASQNGHENTVTLLLDRGADIETRDKEGVSPLHIASLNGHENTVKLLLDRGADIEAKSLSSETPVFKAAKAGHINIIQILHQYKADIESKNREGRSPFNYSAVTGSIDIINGLSKLGADLESRDNNSFSPLDNSIIHGHVNVMEYLMDRLMDEEEMKRSIRGMLSLAAKHGQKDVIAILLKKIKLIQSFDTDFSSIEGGCPLLVALSNSNSECVRLLHSLETFTSYFTEDRFTNSLSESGSIDIYQYLLVVGMNPHAIDSSGYKPHEYLSYNHHIDWEIIETALSPLNKFRGTKTSQLKLVNQPGIGSVRLLPDDIRSNVSKYVHDKVTKKRIISPKLIGSSAEGTKIGLTDEFDYMLLSDIEVIIKKIVDRLHGYRRNDTGNIRDNNSKIFHNFDKIMHINVKDKTLIAPNRVVSGGGAASTPIKIRYQDKENPVQKLVVSVDLVPYLQVNDWPSDAIQKTWLMNAKELRARGYQLVAKPPHRESTYGKTFKESDREKLYRISFSLLEVEHIKTLEGDSQQVKEAYIMAKCLRNPVVSQVVIRDCNGVFHFVDKFITSYLLKTVFLHNVEDFLQDERPILEMTYILYAQLEYYLSHGFIPLFWVPTINLLEGDKMNFAISHKVAMHMKAFLGELYRVEFHKDPPQDVNDRVHIPEYCTLIDTTEAAGLEILTLPLKL